MKFDAMAHAYAWMFNPMLGKYYKKYLPERDFKAIKPKLNAEYRAMVERTPALNKGNLLTPNLVMGCYFFALAKADPAITPETIDNIFTWGFSSNFMKKVHEGKKKKGELFTEKHQNMRLAAAAETQTSTYEMDWRYTYVKGDNEFWCTYTACGLCKLAQRENMMAYLPALCKSDYLNYELVGARLERSKTLANGDDCCDFHVTRIQ